MPSREFYSQLKLREMVATSAPPVPHTPPGLSAIDPGDVVQNGGGLDLGATAPRFYDANGQTVTSIACGAPYSFEVPGYTRVYLILTKDGVKTYDAFFDTPMLNYLSSCTTDPGVYVATAYDPVNGQAIGAAQLTVTGPSGGGLLSGMSTTTMLLIGAGALLLFMRRK